MLRFRLGSSFDDYVLRFQYTLWEWFIIGSIEVEYLIPLDSILVIHDDIVEVAKLEIKLKDLFHRTLFFNVKISVTGGSFQYIDDVVFIHEVKCILFNRQSQTFIRFNLEYALMTSHFWYFWVALHNLAHSVLPGDVVNEVPVILNHVDLLKESSSYNIFLVLIFLLIFRSVGVNCVPSFDVENFGFDQTLGKLCPDVRFEEFVPQGGHRALHHRPYDRIILRENIIIVKRCRLEVSNLCLNIERVYEYDVDLVLLLVLRSESCCHEREVRAAFYSQVLWVEPYVLKGIEFKPANEFLIVLKIKNVFCFLFGLVNVLKNYLVVAKVVSNAWHV